MVRGEREGGSGDIVKTKKVKGKQNLERSEIPSDKEEKGKRAAHTKVIPLINIMNYN